MIDSFVLCPFNNMNQLTDDLQIERKIAFLAGKVCNKVKKTVECRGEDADECRELPVRVYGGINIFGFCGGLKTEGLMQDRSAAVIGFDDLCFLAELTVAHHELLVHILGKVIYLDPCLVTLHRKVVAA